MLNPNGYRDLKPLAQGRERIVYSAIRESDQKPVVLKALRSEHPSTDTIALMYHEYEVVKDLDLPSILQTYDLIDQNNQYALVQENMQGISLQEYLRKNPIKQISEFLKLALQMTHILGELHQHHIIHKDIKPSNFIIHPETLVLKLTDFNFSSKLLHETQGIVPPSKLEGTLAYMPPEQTGRMNMNIDYRADFYSLGVTFFEMLAGQLPFMSEDPMELLHAHLTTPPPALLNPFIKIPPMVIKIIEKLMAKNPSDRYQSTIGLLADLKECLNQFEKSADIQTFTLGQLDVFERLNLSQKLYGRQVEAKILLATYDRVSQGAVEALMVCGYSGIGKTMLINEVHKPMVQHKGYFISGKFDQLQRNTPYTAVTQAFNQLAKLILAEPEWRFIEIKKEMLEVLGGVAQVIIDLAPAIELIIGPQPPLEKLPPQETQNRRMIFFKRFLHVIANKKHPLVLFIDDLQWADSGSLTLLKYILTEPELGYVLLIGAYRDNEVDEHHILRRFFKEIENFGKSIPSLALGPLSLENFEAFFMDSFNRNEDSIKPFATLIHKRTEGNPFFCKQVVMEVYKEDLLFFDHQQHAWDWNLEAIAALKITDNVVDLMVAKFAKLPENTQELLKLAACIGSRFSAGLLITISGKSPDEIAQALWPALDQELILSFQLGYKRMHSMTNENQASAFLKDIHYQFAHDRVQQSVYQKISSLEKNRVHLQIARMLLSKEPEACKKERLFEVTDHFNEAGDFIEPREGLVVAELNYEAALKASAANAYQPMLNYLKKALNLTKSLSWEEHHEFLFNLNLIYIESLYLTHSLVEASELSKSLINHAKNRLEEVSIYRKQIIHAVFAGNIDESLDIALKSLEMLGIKLPKQPSYLQILIKAYRIKHHLKKYNLNTLEKDLVPISNKEMTAALELMGNMFMTAFWGRGNLFSYLPLVGLEIILDFGMHESASSWIMLYSILLLNITKNVADSFDLLHVANRLYGQIEHKLLGFPTDFTEVVYLNHLRFPFESGRLITQRIIDTARETGGAMFGSAGLIFNYEIARCEAKSIQDLIKTGEGALSSCQNWQLTDLSNMMELRLSVPQSQATGKEDFNLQLTQYEKILQGQNILTSTIASMYMAYHFFFLELYENILPYHEHWWAQEKRMRYMIYINTQKTLDALAIAKCLPNLPFFKKIHFRHRIIRICRDLKWAAKQCPHNYQHQYLMLVGIKAELKGRFDEAVDAYEKAAENSKKGNFYLWVAIANECSGDLFMKKKHIFAAKSYITEACYYYERYGMMLKVNALQRRYPECFVDRVETSSGGSVAGGSGPYTITATTTTAGALDFMSIIKASQAISSEIVIERLFEKILHILLENAGAEKALFIERNKNTWMVIAKLAREKDQEKFEILNIPLKEFQNLPHAIIQYSVRSEETVVLSHAAEDTQYRQDPYILQAQPKSVLCLPVLHHDEVFGIIYLENNLTINAFTQDRITVLSTLASQIAISLENSRYLSHMEKLYRKTERFVPKRFLEIIHKENIEEVSLGDCAKRDISVLFNDIRSFTTLVENYSPESAFAFINRYWKFMAPIIRQHGGYIDQYQGDAILAIFPNKPEDAVQAAVAMMKALEGFNVVQRENNDLPIGMGIGVSTGPAMLGVIGEEERQVSGLISDVANTAARVEGLNKSYGSRILFSNATEQALPKNLKIHRRRVDKVKLKGKQQITEIFEVIEWGEELKSISLEDYLKQFSEAFSAYEKGDFKKAESQFSACLTLFPNDKVASLLRERCQQFLSTGSPPDWDGTFTMLNK